ncbi:MAG: tRNA (uridine(34)/cytosine(34)/5-carboxymethylaminomethyluridine(34)-2'-O)-methyltransferase TrmL [Gammaproteobacteria bacterium]
MFHVVLYEPQIPPNAGNIIRLCANSGASLHLVQPLGFRLDDRQMRRAGLDYRERAVITVHRSLAEFRDTVAPARMFALSTRGQRRYDSVEYRSGDALLFGPETRGLPQAVLDSIQPQYVLRIPMVCDSRSLNLANAVAIVVYEAWRQQDFRARPPQH